MMRTYRELLEFGKSRLQEQEIENSQLDAWLLMEYVCQISRTWYFLHEEEQPGEDEEKQYIALIRKREEHIPLQQLTHEAYFYGMKFYVDENVLAPRPDTEILVEQVLEKLPVDQETEILDLCTGSGCILLSILANRKEARGTGADLSEKALAVAERNGRELGIKARWIHSDLFEKIQGQYHAIVSNPPYIRTDVIQGLMEEVRLYEPYMALDGHEDGLHFYRKIIAQAGDYLKPQGLLAFEIGYDQGEAVSSLMKEQGYRQVQVVKDLAGLDRVVTGRKNQEERYV